MLDCLSFNWQDELRLGRAAVYQICCPKRRIMMCKRKRGNPEILLQCYNQAQEASGLATVLWRVLGPHRHLLPLSELLSKWNHNEFKVGTCKECLLTDLRKRKVTLKLSSPGHLVSCIALQCECENSSGVFGIS